MSLTYFARARMVSSTSNSSPPQHDRKGKGKAVQSQLTNAQASHVLTHLDYLGIIARKMLSTVKGLDDTVRDIKNIMKDEAGRIPSVVLGLRTSCEELIDIYEDRLVFLDEMC